MGAQQFAMRHPSRPWTPPAHLPKPPGQSYGGDAQVPQSNGGTAPFGPGAFGPAPPSNVGSAPFGPGGFGPPPPSTQSAPNAQAVAKPLAAALGSLQSVPATAPNAAGQTGIVPVRGIINSVARY